MKYNLDVSNIFTPINVVRFEKLLSGYDEELKSYLWLGLREGF